MSVELLNLVKAKRVAGDVQWLQNLLHDEWKKLPYPLQNRMGDWLRLSTGYISFETFSLAADGQRCEIYALLLAILIRKDYDKLSLPANQSEAEHAEMLAKLTEIVNHPDLAAKIQITITTNEKTTRP